MSNDWVSIVEYRNTMEADLAKAQLEMEDIECELSGDYDNNVMPALGVMGPVRVMVRESAVDRAREVLQRDEEPQAEES